MSVRVDEVCSRALEIGLGAIERIIKIQICTALYQNTERRRDGTGRGNGTAPCISLGISPVGEIAPGVDRRDRTGVRKQRTKGKDVKTNDRTRCHLSSAIAIYGGSRQLEIIAVVNKSFPQSSQARLQTRICARCRIATVAYLRIGALLCAGHRVCARRPSGAPVVRPSLKQL